jgi:hypothetical protein
MTGPGKYDFICTKALLAAQAQCALLIILDGKHGDGFSVNFTDQKYISSLPSILREVADQIEHDAKAIGD